jgi:hypothetical protein
VDRLTRLILEEIVTLEKCYRGRWWSDLTIETGVVMGRRDDRWQLVCYLTSTTFREAQCIATLRLAVEERDAQIKQLANTGASLYGIVMRHVGWVDDCQNFERLINSLPAEIRPEMEADHD